MPQSFRDGHLFVRMLALFEALACSGLSFEQDAQRTPLGCAARTVTRGSLPAKTASPEEITQHGTGKAACVEWSARPSRSSSVALKTSAIKFLSIHGNKPKKKLAKTALLCGQMALQMLTRTSLVSTPGSC